MPLAEQGISGYLDSAPEGEDTGKHGSSAAEFADGGAWKVFVKRTKRVLLLFVITLFSIVVHGYHTGTDDAAIYAPGIKKTADPSLYPFGSEFFMHHARLSLFPQLVAAVT